MSRGLFKQEETDSITTGPVGSGDLNGRRRERTEPAVLSLLGPGISVQGDIKADGDIQIEGRVHGSLEVTGRVTIAPRGAVEGDVIADEIVIGGEIEGSVSAHDVARLKSGCRVDADVTSPRIELEEGGVLNGKVRMQKPAGTNVSKPEINGRKIDAAPAAKKGDADQKPGAADARPEAQPA